MISRRHFLAKTATASATIALAQNAFAQNEQSPASNPTPLRDWSNRAAVRYPDQDIRAIDPSFGKYVVGNTEIQRLWTGAQWMEGPVWFGGMHRVVFSDIPNNRLMRWDETTGSVQDVGQVGVFRTPSFNANGNTIDRQGRLLTCEQDRRCISRTEHSGEVTVLADRFEGKRLNSPNDIVVKSDNSIWFTDPGYGISGWYEGHKAEFELPRNVYRLDPETRQLTVVASDFVRPNGLCFSPDEKTLYICDTAVTDGPDNPSHIRMFDVSDDNSLTNGRVFYDMKQGQEGGIAQFGIADGIRADVDGNIWAGTGWAGPAVDGVTVFSPSGEKIGRIMLPEICANIAFGGEKRNRLFMAASTSLYAVYVNTQGVDLTQPAPPVSTGSSTPPETTEQQ